MCLTPSSPRWEPDCPACVSTPSVLSDDGTHLPLPSAPTHSQPDRPALAPHGRTDPAGMLRTTASPPTAIPTQRFYSPRGWTWPGPEEGKESDRHPQSLGVAQSQPAHIPARHLLAVLQGKPHVPDFTSLLLRGEGAGVYEAPHIHALAG